jgi:hypothetical protein
MACQDVYNVEIETLEKKIHQTFKNIIENKSYLIIIPQSGCPGCIDRALKFVKDDISENPIFLVVLTNVSDKKYFYFLAGAKLLDNKNVQFDQNNEIGELSHTTIYPKIIFLKKGKIKSIVEVTPNDKNIWQKIAEN